MTTKKSRQNEFAWYEFFKPDENGNCDMFIKNKAEFG